MDRDVEYSIFLHIIEGIGFNEKSGGITLNATLNGVKFEIQGHNTETTTIFNSNCIWECMYEDLRRMRTDNRPIKVECFHKAPQKGDKDTKKAIGFFLLPLRTVQVVKTLRNLQIKLHWHKVCGLAAEWRQAKPEIYLSVIVATNELMKAGQLEEFLEPKPIDNSKSIYIRPSETSLLLQSQQGIYVKLLEDECRLQVGNGPNDCDTFVVTLTLTNAKHLSQLSLGSGKNSLFRFHYEFLGCPSDVVLAPNSNGLYSINEKISVSFKSSLESLMEYFKRVFYIPIDLYYNDSIIGNYRFTCDGILPSSLEVFRNDEPWLLKDEFVLQTLFDIIESSDRPTIEYVLSLSYVPAENTKQTLPFIDKRARGDMADENVFFELPQTIQAPEAEKVMRSCRSDSLVASKPTLDGVEPDAHARSASQRNEKLYRSDPVVISQPTPENLAYQVIAELEDWKCQQMEEFLVEIKRKEAFHLRQLSTEWERQKKELTQKLQDKLDECSRLTESLEEAQEIVRAKGLKQFEEERAFEKTKHELDKRYTVRFMEIEEKARRIKDDMEYQLKLQELRFKEQQIEKNREAEEIAQLRSKVAQLEGDMEERRMKWLPKEQLAGLFEDLREQKERYTEMEKSKRFYKEQWAMLIKEVHQLKLQSLKAQEEKLKQTGCMGIDNLIGFRNLIFEERTALLTDRQELKTIAEALTSDSEDC